MATIAEVNELDEDEIMLGLMGTEAEREAALVSLYAGYNERIMHYLERKFPGLRSDLQANAMVDSFRALYEKVASGGFSYDKPLIGFLYKVAYWRAVDELREYGCRTLGRSEFYECVGEVLEQTDEGEAWKVHLAEGSAVEIAQLFRDFLLTLPPVQRQVAQIMADGFPETTPEDEVCEIVFNRTEKRPTVVQVKSAKREIRTKFERILKQKV